MAQGLALCQHGNDFSPFLPTLAAQYLCIALREVAEYYGASSIAAEFVRVYFCALLILGGIIGMSFINSIFVDAMVADNNDDVMNKLTELQKTLDELKKQTEYNGKS